MAYADIRNQIYVFIESAVKLLQNAIGEENYAKAKLYAWEHPFIFTAILSVVTLSVVPLLLFVGFIISTLGIALVCFLCIEGSIIAVSGLVLIGIVVVISIVVGSILTGLAVSFWALQKLGLCVKFIRSSTNYTPTTNHQNSSSVNGKESDSE